MNILILVVRLFANRVGLNSRNSSKPPSTDPNRPKDPPKNSNTKPGGQKGHVGQTLEKIGKPDETLAINIDRETLPKGLYTEGGFETRQVFDIHICRKVTEYQAQVLVDEKGKRFVAPFPEGVSKAAQYGKQVKAHAVYMSQYQLIPSMHAYGNILPSSCRSRSAWVLFSISTKLPTGYWKRLAR
jgi:transposase